MSAELDDLDTLLDTQIALQNLTFADRARLMAQGALMNFSDEFFAMVRSALGDETYEEALGEERESLKKAQEKEGSLKYEIGGAMAPALALAPFTAGTSIPATVGRYAIGTGGKLMTQGAIQGGVSALGRQEGDTDFVDVGLSTAGGAVANPLLQKVGGKMVEGIGKISEPIIRKIKGQLAKPVEDELARIANSSGMTTDEIIEQIASGKTIPELSETAAAEVRGFYVASEKSKPIIAESLVSRKEQGMEDVFGNLQRDLSPNEQIGNVFKYINGSINAIKKGASDNYKQIYNKFDNFRSNNINLAIEEALQKQPQLRPKIRSLMTGLGKGTPFEVKDGVLKLTQDVDLETAENIRGLLLERANKLYQSGDGRLGEVASALEKNLRGIIDEASPELSVARNNWARIMKAKESFDVGRSIFTKQADEAEVIFERILASGDREAIDSFRAGVASAIRGKKQGGTSVNFINKLGDLSSKESLILQKIYPDEALDNVIDKINLAKASIMAQGRIMGGSPTAETTKATSRVGTVDDAYALTRVLASGGTDIGAGVQLLKKFIPTKSNQLNDEQMTEVARLLISEDKDLLRNALTNNEARQQLVQKINELADRFVAGLAKAGVQEASDLTENASIVTDALATEENAEDQQVNEAIEPIIKDLDEETKQKLLQVIGVR